MRNCVRADIIHGDWQARGVVGIFHNFCIPLITT